jgi:hypothetical protein
VRTEQEVAIPDEEMIASLTKVDLDDLVGEQCTIAANYAWLAEQVAAAMSNERSARKNRDEIRGQVSTQVRMVAEAAGKKITVADVDSQVSTHGRVSDAENRLAEAEATHFRLKESLTALRIKAKMLESLGIHSQSEWSLTRQTQ